MDSPLGIARDDNSTVRIFPVRVKILAAVIASPPSLACGQRGRQVEECARCALFIDHVNNNTGDHYPFRDARLVDSGYGFATL
jgi:hypothetical protein